MEDLDKKNGEREPGFSGEKTQPSASVDDEPSSVGFELIYRERSPMMNIPGVGIVICKCIEDSDALVVDIINLTKTHVLAVVKSPDDVGLINFPPSNMLMRSTVNNGLRTGIDVKGQDWSASTFSLVDMSELCRTHDFDERMRVVIFGVLRKVRDAIGSKGASEKFDVSTRVTRDLRARGGRASIPRPELRLEQRGPKK